MSNVKLIKLYLLGQKAWQFNKRLPIYCYNDSWKILEMYVHNFCYKYLKFEFWQNA